MFIDMIKLLLNWLLMIKFSLLMIKLTLLMIKLLTWLLNWISDMVIIINMFIND